MYENRENVFRLKQKPVSIDDFTEKEEKEINEKIEARKKI